MLEYPMRCIDNEYVSFYSRNSVYTISTDELMRRVVRCQRNDFKNTINTNHLKHQTIFYANQLDLINNRGPKIFYFYDCG